MKIASFIGTESMDDFDYLHEAFNTELKTDKKISLPAPNLTQFIPGKDFKISEINNLLSRVSPSKELLFIKFCEGEELGDLIEKIHLSSHQWKELPLTQVDCSNLSVKDWKSIFTPNRNIQSGTIALHNVESLPYILQENFKNLDLNFRYILTSQLPLEETGIPYKSFNFSYHTLSIPPIRERPNDISYLLQAALNKIKGNIIFASNTIDILKQYPWPSNFKEITSLVQKLNYEKSGQVIIPENLPRYFLHKYPKNNFVMALPAQGIDLKEIIFQIEDSLILQALIRTTGNKNQASKLLNLNRTTLIEKMKKRGIETF